MKPEPPEGIYLEEFTLKELETRALDERAGHATQDHHGQQEVHPVHAIG